MPVSIEKQMERRRKILACTRETMKNVGPDQLNIREIAKRCGVSVPTLYNQFNSKDELLYAASAELYRHTLERIRDTCDQSGLDRFIFILDSIDEMIRSNPSISRQLVRLTPAKSESVVLGAEMYTQPFIEMYEQGALLEWLDPIYLGKRIFERVRSVLLEWSYGRLSDDDVLPSRRIEAYFTLLGVCKGAARNRVESLLRKEISKLKS